MANSQTPQISIYKLVVKVKSIKTGKEKKSEHQMRGPLFIGVNKANRIKSLLEIYTAYKNSPGASVKGHILVSVEVSCCRCFETFYP